MFLSMIPKAPAYLSIDLDYWMNHKSPLKVGDFMRRVAALPIPILIVPTHERIIEHVSDSGCLSLYNVDYHSDLIGCARRPRDKDEGNWVNHVSWRKCGFYDWRYPSKVSVLGGFCHGGTPNPFDAPECAGWHRTRMQRGVHALPWSAFKAASICISWSWLVGLPLPVNVTDLLHDRTTPQTPIAPTVYTNILSALFPGSRHLASTDFEPFFLKPGELSERLDRTHSKTVASAQSMGVAAL